MSEVAGAEAVGRPAIPNRERSEPSDRRLLRAARKGSPEAVEALIERHWDQAHRIAYGILGDAHAAEDVTQEAMLSVLGNIGRFDPFQPSTRGCIGSPPTAPSTGLAPADRHQPAAAHRRRTLGSRRRRTRTSDPWMVTGSSLFSRIYVWILQPRRYFRRAATFAQHSAAHNQRRGEMR